MADTRATTPCVSSALAAHGASWFRELDRLAAPYERLYPSLRDAIADAALDALAVTLVHFRAGLGQTFGDALALEVKRQVLARVGEEVIGMTSTRPGK